MIPQTHYFSKSDTIPLFRSRITNHARYVACLLITVGISNLRKSVELMMSDQAEVRFGVMDDKFLLMTYHAVQPVN